MQNQTPDLDKLIKRLSRLAALKSRTANSDDARNGEATYTDADILEREATLLQDVVDALELTKSGASEAAHVRRMLEIRVAEMSSDWGIPDYVLDHCPATRQRGRIFLPDLLRALTDDRYWETHDMERERRLWLYHIEKRYKAHPVVREPLKTFRRNQKRAEDQRSKDTQEFLPAHHRRCLALLQEHDLPDDYLFIAHDRYPKAVTAALDQLEREYEAEWQPHITVFAAAFTEALRAFAAELEELCHEAA